MRSWIIFLGLLFTTFTQAQVITGRVTDLNNHPIELAVVIIQTNDSVYVNSIRTLWALLVSKRRYPLSS